MSVSVHIYAMLWTTATDLAKFVIAIQQSLKDARPSFLEKRVAEETLTLMLSSFDAALGRGRGNHFEYSPLPEPEAAINGKMLPQLKNCCHRFKALRNFSGYRVPETIPAGIRASMLSRSSRVS